MTLTDKGKTILPGYETVAFDGRGSATDRCAALLIHGIAARPRQLENLARPLADAGLDVVVPLLPGHGTSPKDMSTLTWHDWNRCIEQAYNTLKENHERVMVIGFSLGAALALELASNFHLAALVLLNTPLKTFVPFVPQAQILKMLGRLNPFVPTFRKSLRQEDGRRSAAGVYPWVPASALRTTLELSRRNRDRLDRITAPTLILHATADFVSHRKGAYLLAEKLASVEKKVVWVRTRDHEISLFDKKDYVIEQILDFTVCNGLIRTPSL